jgi:hypothetical protein
MAGKEREVWRDHFGFWVSIARSDWEILIGRDGSKGKNAL